jgi:4-hydroxy-tetrahydrodipicolinate synthase
MNKISQGVYGVLCTPFTQDDKIDETALRKHVRFLVDEGKIHGVIPNGSTGEFTALCKAERETTAKIVIDEAAGKVPVVVGTASVSTKETVMYTQHAANSGADGVMIVPPYYCHPNDEEIFGHYKTIAENSDIEIMVYNNPGTSGVDMKPELIACLAEFERISHVKESSGDITRVAEIQRLCGDKMRIFCGCDNLSLEMFIMGVAGWVAPVANMIPKLCVELYELAAVKKDFEKARELYFKLLPLFTMFETTGQYIQLTKAGLEILGRPYGIPRKPLLPPTDEHKQQLRETLATLPI